MSEKTRDWELCLSVMSTLLYQKELISLWIIKSAKSLESTLLFLFPFRSMSSPVFNPLSVSPLSAFFRISKALSAYSTLNSLWWWWINQNELKYLLFFLSISKSHRHAGHETARKCSDKNFYWISFLSHFGIYIWKDERNRPNKRPTISRTREKRINEMK